MSGRLQCWAVFAAIVTAACHAAPTALVPTTTGFVDMSTANVPMQPFGRARRSGELLTIEFEHGSTNEVSWADWPKAPR